MSSSQGSIALNTNGGHEVYRASKSALNQLMRSYAARHRKDTRTLLLLNPGWVQTDLGGEGAQLTIDQSVPALVRHHPGPQRRTRTSLPRLPEPHCPLVIAAPVRDVGSTYWLTATGRTPASYTADLLAKGTSGVGGEPARASRSSRDRDRRCRRGTDCPVGRRSSSPDRSR